MLTKCAHGLGQQLLQTLPPQVQRTAAWGDGRHLWQGERTAKPASCRWGLHRHAEKEQASVYQAIFRRYTSRGKCESTVESCCHVALTLAFGAMAPWTRTATH